MASPLPSLLSRFWVTEHLAIKEIPYVVIEQVASTTLPGLAAKPIIVILAFLAAEDLTVTSIVR